MSMMRRTEARHDALRAASDGRLTFDPGMALSKGSFWVTLPGMPEADKTTSRGLTTAVNQLLAGRYLRFEYPGVPRRSGKVLVTDAGLALLERFDAQTANA
jgi:hypothetical protein